MADTLTTLNAAPAPRRPGPPPLELSVLAALGTLRLAPPPPAVSQVPTCQWVGTLPPAVTASDVTPSRRRYISARCCDVGVAVLILSSAAVLYRLL